MREVFVLLVAGLFFGGCASTTNGLQKATARNIQENVPSSQITIYDIERGAMNVDWKATTPDGTTYNCSADDMVRQVSCKK